MDVARIDPLREKEPPATRKEERNHQRNPEEEGTGPPTAFIR